MLTADNITDEQIREGIADIETDLAILQAALKVRKGQLAADIRARCAELLNARAKERP